MGRVAVDISSLDDRATDTALEGLTRAATGQDSRIWAPHWDRASAALIEAYYEWAKAGLDGCMDGLADALGLQRRPWVFAKAETTGDVGDGALSMPVDEWTALIDRIVASQFGADAVREAAEAAAIRSYLTGRVNYALIGDGTMRDRFAALPTTIDGAMARGGLGEADKRTMEYLRAKAGVNLQTASDGLRSGIKRTIIEAHEQRLTPKQTEQSLFDQFGESNRDMRRVALTEAAEGRGQGTIAAQPEGGVLVRHESADACPYCKSIDGKEYVVVSPDADGKNWQTQVWVGKTNVGRSRHAVTRSGRKRDESEMWAPCACVHPHCRGLFRPKLVKPSWLK